MTTEIESYEEQRARAWNHKQQLDSLPTFTSKLHYWLDKIDSWPSGADYVTGENTPFTLALYPETDDDRREFNRAWMEHYRKEKIDRKEPVYKFGWQWSEADKEKVAFHVESFDARKSNLELRLLTVLRKKDLLQQELAATTAAIDIAVRMDNGFLSTLVNELRYNLETNRSYDFALTDDSYPYRKPIQLAQVWDIVHYEAHLKDRLVDLKSESSPSEFTSPPIVVPAATRDNETPAPATSRPVATNEPNSNDWKKQVRLILAPLSGSSPTKKPIMSKKDFDRLIDYVDHLVLTDNLPAVIVPIAQTDISNEHIRYTFYRLHKELFTTKKKRPSFISFLHTVFTQFAGTSQTTTNSKFSTPPASYNKDFTGYIGEVA